VQNGAGADGVFLQKGHPGDQQWAMSRPPGCFMWDTLIYIYIVYIYNIWLYIYIVYIYILYI
jgi:hypothetical protein